MYKMVVCDLDETLLNSDGTLSDENANAIKAATKKGVYFVANSGRSFTSFQDTLEKLGLKGQANQYSISFNGGLILENKDNRTFSINSMSYEIAKNLFKVGTKNPLAATHVYTTEQLYVYNLIPDDKEYLENRGVDYEVLKDTDFDRFQDATIMKVIMALPTMQERINLKTEAEKIIDPKDLAVTFSSNRYVEFNPAGVNKGTASLQLGEKLGIKADEIIAIGDNSNDLPMLEVAGLPVSVANGIDSMKKAAKYVTQADNDHAAVAEVINKFILG